MNAPAGRTPVIEAFIRARVAEYANLPEAEIGVDTPLAEYGLDSVAAVSLCADIEDELRVSVEPTIAWDYPTIAGMAAFLSTQAA